MVATAKPGMIPRMHEIRGELKALEGMRQGSNREFNPEERQRIDALLAEQDEIDQQRRNRLAQVLAEESVKGAPMQSSYRSSDPVTNPDGSKYSLLRAINCRLSGRELDGYEGEISQEIARRTGNSPQGFFMPLGLPTGERRDLDTSAGAGLVQTVTMGSRFIDALRNRTVLASLGATILSGLNGDLEVPKQTGTGAAYWVAEGTAVTESAQAIGQVRMSPSTVGAFTDVTRKLLKQSGSVDVERLVRNDLVQVLGIELDRVGINGSGTGVEPTGILQNGSIPTVAIGTNGGAPTWAKIVELESTVKTANADRGAMAYLTSNHGRGKLKTVTKGDAGYPIFLWNDENRVNAYRAESSSQLPSNLTKGSGTDLTAMIFGDFSTVFIGIWGMGVDVLIDPYTLGISGGVRITTLLDCDVQFRNVESLAKIVDMVRV